MENIVASQSNRILKSQKYMQLNCVRKLKSRFPENQFKIQTPPSVFEVKT